MAVEVRTEKMAAGGDALAHLPDGRVAFVRGALPEEAVALRVVQSKKDFVKAEVIEVVTASPYRVAPPCPAHAAGCGGCSWQFVAADQQLPLKTEIVAEAMRRTGKIADAQIIAGPSVPPWAYRTSVRVAAGAAGRLGLRAHSSHHVVELHGCMVSHPRLEDLLGMMRVRGEGEVVLRVSASSGERSAWVAAGDLDLIDVPADVAVGAGAVIHEDVAGVRFQVSAASFFQSGPTAAELLVDAVGDAVTDLGGVRHLVDAYGGVGLFAATIDAERVTLVESSAPACTDAIVNLAGRGRACTVVNRTVEKWDPSAADVVIADPSRRGLGRDAVDVVTATGAARIVLVSCDPVALARDARLLNEQGYRHRRSTVLDLFPQTPHVEVVTVFEPD